MRFAIENAFRSGRSPACEVAGGAGDSSRTKIWAADQQSAVIGNYRLDKLTNPRLNVRPPEPEASSATKSRKE